MSEVPTIPWPEERTELHGLPELPADRPWEGITATHVQRVASGETAGYSSWLLPTPYDLRAAYEWFVAQEFVAAHAAAATRSLGWSSRLGHAIRRALAARGNLEKEGGLDDALAAFHAGTLNQIQTGNPRTRAIAGAIRANDIPALTELLSASRGATGSTEADTETAYEAAIYVYSFPTYLQSPDERGHVLMKVGMTERNAVRRVLSQQRQTNNLEEPEVIGVYPVASGDARSVERQLHELLAAFGTRQVGPTIGAEVFRSTPQAIELAMAALGYAPAESED